MAKTTVVDPGYVLSLNAGSATLKWALYQAPELTELGRGVVERVGESGSFAEWRLQGKIGVKKVPCKNHEVAVGYILKLLAWHHLNLQHVTVVGHRVVHGGALFSVPTKLTAKVFQQLKGLTVLAPLHNPVQVAVAKTTAKLLPKAQQVAVFDTAWYSNLPPEARLYALPESLTKKYNLRRYGFHGLSHSYVSSEAARRLCHPLQNLNLITCHLGSGASITAVRAGRAIDTSMGFTPLEGLVMDTRAGDVDPGLLLYLITQKGLQAKALLKLLDEDSGLKGVAGVPDMREVLTRAGYEVLGFRPKGTATSGDKKRAQLALKLFLYRVQKYLGAYAAVLGTVHAIVFTGGIGERNEVVRNLIMQGVPGLKHIPVLAIPTNEELAIAQQVASLA